MSLSTPGHPYQWAVNGPPVGIWHTETGSASLMMHDVLRLNADGRGELLSSSAMSGNETARVAWRQSNAGVLHLIRFFSDESIDTIEEEMWEVVHYVTDWLTNDTGDHIPVLRNAHNNVFWSLVGPVRLR